MVNSRKRKYQDIRSYSGDSSASDGYSSASDGYDEEVAHFNRKVGSDKDGNKFLLKTSTVDDLVGYFQKNLTFTSGNRTNNTPTQNNPGQGNLSDETFDLATPQELGMEKNTYYVLTPPVTKKITQEMQWVEEILKSTNPTKDESDSPISGRFNPR